jgi:transposase-like protein
VSPNKIAGGLCAANGRARLAARALVNPLFEKERIPLEPIRKRLRTSNLCEALHKQIRRRTRVAAIFPNPESCLRLVSAILMEISEAWETSKAYLNPQLLK